MTESGVMHILLGVVVLWLVALTHRVWVYRRAIIRCQDEIAAIEEDMTRPTETRVWPKLVGR